MIVQTVTIFFHAIGSARQDLSRKFLRELPLVDSVPDFSTLDLLFRHGLMRNGVRVKLPILDDVLWRLFAQDERLQDLTEPSSTTSTYVLGLKLCAALMKDLASPEDEITVACECVTLRT